MTNRRRVLIFGLVALVQLAATGSSIALYESTLRTGEPLRFRLAPVDPVDPMRGYYAALRFEESPPRVIPDEDTQVLSSCFAVLAVGDDGFARVTRIVATRPRTGRYVRVELESPGDASMPSRITFPFDRFYADARTAASVERAFFGPAGTREAFAVVRVDGGRGVIESLVVNGRDVTTGRFIAPR